MDGTATKLKANATKDDIIKAALDVWNKRLATARETGRKLQQSAFSIQCGRPDEKGYRVYFVRPRQTGLEFYQRADFGVAFETHVQTKTYGVKE